MHIVAEKSTRPKGKCKDAKKGKYFSFCSPQHNPQSEQKVKNRKERERERTLKQAIISRKVNIVRRCCPDTFVVRTFETKRVSKQVKSARTQCLPFHVLPPPRWGLISRCCISCSVTNTMRCLAASKAHL